jgi:hypothetical protein
MTNAFANKSQLHNGNIKPRQLPHLERQSSPPIPIKSTPSVASVQDSSTSVQCNDEAHYNMLTWQMYNRIMTARRIRAYSLQNSEDSLVGEYYHAWVDYNKYTHDKKGSNQANSETMKEIQVHVASAASNISSSEEEHDDDYGEVFELEIM